MPEEIFAIIVIFILFVLAPAGVFRGIKALRESRPAEGSRSSDGNEMRRSELEALIEDAVIEATSPLAARIDELERELLLGEGRISREVLEETLGNPDEFESTPERRRLREG